MALYRERLTKRSIKSSRDLEAMRDGQAVTTAGMMLIHQSPPTTKGFHKRRGAARGSDCERAGARSEADALKNSLRDKIAIICRKVLLNIEIRDDKMPINPISEPVQRSRVVSREIPNCAIRVRSCRSSSGEN